MNELRWILLGIGIVLLALIYLFARRSGTDDNSLPARETRYEPSLSADDPVELSDDLVEPSLDNDAVISETAAGRFDSIDTQTSAGAFAVSDTVGIETDSHTDPELDQTSSSYNNDLGSETGSEPQPESSVTPLVPEKVIALHLMPKSGQTFDGVEFIGAIQAEGLKFGRFDIFHRLANAKAGEESAPSQFSLANMIKPGTFNLRDLESQEFKGASMFLVLPGPDDAVAAFADMVATGRRLAATLDGQLLDAQGTALSRQSASHLREDIINYQHGLSAAPAE